MIRINKASLHCSAIVPTHLSTFSSMNLASPTPSESCQLAHYNLQTTNQDKKWIRCVCNFNTKAKRNVALHYLRKTNFLNIVSWPNSDGMVPVRSLSAKIKTTNIKNRLRWHKTRNAKDKTAFQSYYLQKSTEVICVNWPNSVGIDPVISLQFGTFKQAIIEEMLGFGVCEIDPWRKGSLLT